MGWSGGATMEVAMHYVPKLLSAGPAFFLSAWFLMLFAGALSSDVGIRPFGYPTAMIVTIALWIVLVPAIGAVARGTKKKRAGRVRADV
jgi:hypothetical protein